MKVAIVVHGFNIRGGTHKQVHRLAEHLLAAGDQPIIFTKYFDPARCYPGIERLQVVAASRRGDARPGRFLGPLLDALVSLRLALHVARFADVVNVHDNGLLLFWLALRLLRPRLETVWQINDMPAAFRLGTAKELKPRLGGRIHNAIVRALSRLMARRVSLVTVNVAKNAARAEAHLGAPARVFHCGVDLRNASLPVRPRPGGALRLVTTGVFQRYRNYETIVRAQRRLADAHGVESRLTILGTTETARDYAAEVALLAQELGVACDIRGEVSEDELLRTYQESDVFLFLNVDQSWGLAVFEAMNCGLPVVVSESVGAVELLRPESDSLLVDPLDVDRIAETLFRLHGDPALRTSLAEAGFASTLRMTWGRLYCEPVRQELLRSCSRQSTDARTGSKAA